MQTSLPVMTSQSRDVPVPILSDTQEIPSPLLTPVATTPSPLPDHPFAEECDASPPPLPNKKTAGNKGNSTSNPTSLTTTPNHSPVRTPESMIRSQSIPSGVMPLIPQGIDLEEDEVIDRDESSSV